MLGASDVGVRDQNGVVTQGPWMARDSFVAETAIKLDRVSAKLERLERNSDVVSRHVTDLMDHAHQASRFQAFAESLRNAREYKLDEFQRCLKDVKTRLEQVEGPKSKHQSMTYRSFETVDEKLAELAILQAKFVAIERAARISIVMFTGSLMILATVVAISFF